MESILPVCHVKTKKCSFLNYGRNDMDSFTATKKCRNPSSAGSSTDTTPKRLTRLDLTHLHVFSLIGVYKSFFFLANLAFLFIRCVMSVEIPFLFCYFVIFSLFSFGNLFVLSNIWAHNYVEFLFTLHACFAQLYPH